MSPTLSALVVLTAAIPHAADPSWNGVAVVLRPGAVLRNGDKVVDDGHYFRIYRVKEFTGGRVRVGLGDVEGSAPVKDVIRLSKAVDYYSEQIRNNRRAAWPYAYRANVWRAQRRYDMAIADYSRAIDIEPNAVAHYTNRGATWSLKRNYDAAISDFNKVIELDANSSYAYRARADAFLATKQLDKAIADFNEAIRIEPKQAWTYYRRGAVWGQKREFDRAIADYDEAIKLDPKSVWAHNNRAWLLATCPEAKYRNGQRAVEGATKACELSQWKDPTHLDTLAAAYAESGDFAKAVEWQEKANTLFTDHKLKKPAEARLQLYRDKKPYRGD
jgi:tetratricopeptide (TPR) repeat protein